MEGLPKHAGRGSNARQRQVAAPHTENHHIENLDKSVERPVQKALRTPSPGAASWAFLGVPGSSGPRNHPSRPMAVRPRVHRGVLKIRPESPETLGDTKNREHSAPSLRSGYTRNPGPRYAGRETAHVKTGSLQNNGQGKGAMGSRREKTEAFKRDSSLLPRPALSISISLAESY